MYNFKIKTGVLALLISICWFGISFYLNKDLLGGAFYDFKYHEKYFLYFSNDFLNTIKEYGENNEVRNSPFFYMLFSQIFKAGIGVDDLKYFNLIIIFPIVYFFIKCLELKFNKINTNSKLLFVSCIFLSPTISSLINYPYPLIWAICFFLISVYFFLKFKKFDKFKIFNASLSVFNLSIASYFTPNFAVFIIYFFYHFHKEYMLSKKLFFLVILSLFLSLPATFFLIWKDFYLFKNNVFEVSIYEKINFSNKIIIVKSFLILFFIPFIQKFSFDLVKFKKKIKNINFLFLSFLIFLCILTFNYKSGAGGGLFYKLSVIIFKNYLLIILVFIFSIIYFYLNNLLNVNNILIFIILILYNMQYSIYYKYFDPLLMFVFLFLAKIDIGKFENKISRNYLLFYAFFLLMNFFKDDFFKILII